VERPAEYLAWAHRAAGVPTVPTTWVTPGETFSTLPSREFVVEASVSAGGRGTTRYAPGGTAAVELNGL
jgi:hypothetical protein